MLRERQIESVCREEGTAASEYAISLAFIAAAVAATVSHFDLTAVFPAIVAKIARLIM